MDRRRQHHSFITISQKSGARDLPPDKALSGPSLLFAVQILAQARPGPIPADLALGAYRRVRGPIGGCGGLSAGAVKGLPANDPEDLGPRLNDAPDRA